jgi:hypothetical protein
MNESKHQLYFPEHVRGKVLNEMTDKITLLKCDAK